MEGRTYLTVALPREKLGVSDYGSALQAQWNTTDTVLCLISALFQCRIQLQMVDSR